jgi:3-hydroxybutyryl-CoA dehydrogenase
MIYTQLINTNQLTGICMTQIERITTLDAGTIGMSWTALFLAAGKQVNVYDPAVDIEQKVHAFIRASASSLKSLGWKNAGDMSKLSFDNDPQSAVIGSQFIQESIPERLGLNTNFTRVLKRI